MELGGLWGGAPGRVGDPWESTWAPSGSLEAPRGKSTCFDVMIVFSNALLYFVWLDMVLGRCVRTLRGTWGVTWALAGHLAGASAWGRLGDPLEAIWAPSEHLASATGQSSERVITCDVVR